MAQVKVYGRREHLDASRSAISDAIHAAAMATLGLPETKRFHRFIGLDPADFIHPEDRSERYTIVETSMLEGRSTETKKALIRALFGRLEAACGIEITIVETPRHNWGIRGLPADELVLDYQVET